MGHKPILKQTTLYTIPFEDNEGHNHEVLAYDIDMISEDSVTLDLTGVRGIFPGAPVEVFNRPDGPIDIIIGTMYRNLQPFGGEQSFTQGRLRLVKSIFGCGYILTGTHPSITSRENVLAGYSRILGNCTLLPGEEYPTTVVPSVHCNRAITTIKIPEFFESEELGIKA